MFVKPAAGRIVIDPTTNPRLPDEGKAVVGNAAYWLRRKNDGDVTEGTPPAETRKTK
jgi:hypothetical protein